MPLLENVEVHPVLGARVSQFRRFLLFLMKPFLKKLKFLKTSFCEFSEISDIFSTQIAYSAWSLPEWRIANQD